MHLGSWYFFLAEWLKSLWVYERNREHEVLQKPFKTVTFPSLTDVEWNRFHRLSDVFDRCWCKIFGNAWMHETWRGRASWYSQLWPGEDWSSENTGYDILLFLDHPRILHKKRELKPPIHLWDRWPVTPFLSLFCTLCKERARGAWREKLRGYDLWPICSFTSDHPRQAQKCDLACSLGSFVWLLIIHFEEYSRDSKWFQWFKIQEHEVCFLSHFVKFVLPEHGVGRFFQRSLRLKSLNLTLVAVFLRARMMSLASMPTAVLSRRHHGLCSSVWWRIEEILWRPEGNFTNKVIDRFDARRLDLLSELCDITWCQPNSKGDPVQMALFQGVWMLVKHYSWLKWYCSVWCRCFFGPGTFWRSKARCKLRGSRTHTLLGWTQWTLSTSLSWSVVGRRLKLDQEVVKYCEMTWMNSDSSAMYTGYIHHISILLYIYTYTNIMPYRCIQMSHRNCLGFGKWVQNFGTRVTQVVKFEAARLVFVQ